jgi:hypothetical protein
VSYRFFIHAVFSQYGDQVRRNSVEGVVRDVDPGVRRAHGAALVCPGLAERGGDERALVSVEHVHVGAVEVALEVEVIERAPVELVNYCANRALSADGVLDRHLGIPVLM